MSVFVPLTPEAEKRLAARAAQEGKSLEGLIQHIVEKEASASNGSESHSAAEPAASSAAPLPPERDASDESEAPWRGVFAPAYERKVIFTTEIELNTATLPKRQPHVTISPRWIEDDA